MKASIGTADRLVIQTEDGEVYEFALNDVEIEYDKDYEQYGPGPVHTRVTEISATVRGQVFCTKSP